MTYNPPYMLPIVGAKFVILRDGIEVTVIRKSYISSRDDNLVYYDLDDNEIKGRFPWRHL